LHIIRKMVESLQLIAIWW